MTRLSFEDRVLGCVDKGMGTLGDGTSLAVYWHIERTYGLKREEIPGEPQKFMKSLEAIFGAGAHVLEMSVVMEIRSAFGIPDRVASLEQAVRLAKKRRK